MTQLCTEPSHVAGYVTLGFWKGVFRRVGLIRERIGQANSYTLESVQQSVTHRQSAPSSGRTHLPGPASGSGSAAPGENTGEATHDKLTTEPAQEPFTKGECSLYVCHGHKINSIAYSCVVLLRQGCAIVEAA